MFIYLYFWWSKDENRSSIEIEIGDFDLCDVYGEKNENNCHICRYFFISQSNDDVNKFSFYLYPLKKKDEDILFCSHLDSVPMYFPTIRVSARCFILKIGYSDCSDLYEQSSVLNILELEFCQF